MSGSAGKVPAGRTASTPFLRVEEPTHALRP